MESSIFSMTLQSSFIVGLVHGVNPCGHSWLVLAPFVGASRKGRQIATLTASFLSGTALACIALGLTLGGLSSFIPSSLETQMEAAMSWLIILLGLILVINPEILHSHAHEHDEHHGGDAHGHHHDHHHHHRIIKASASALFTIGFVNMIIPCPTAAIMYSYALTSGMPSASAAVFGSYALGTAISVGVIIWGLHKTANWVRSLNKPWIEGAVMRAVGVLIMFAGGYSLMAGA